LNVLFTAPTPGTCAAAPAIPESTGINFFCTHTSGRREAVIAFILVILFISKGFIFDLLSLSRLP
jgi:hypothetical protein